MSRLTIRLAPAAFLALTTLLVLQPGGRLQAVATPSQPLPDPHSYVVTGNYAVASDDVPSQTQPGTVTRTLHINTCNPQANPPIVTNCVPSNADIVAAYLYFEMIDTYPLATDVKFQGKHITNARFSSIVKRSDQPLTGASCFSSSGALVLTMFRADVRYLLPVQYRREQPADRKAPGWRRRPDDQQRQEWTNLSCWTDGRDAGRRHRKHNSPSCRLFAVRRLSRSDRAAEKDRR